jgi:hypothetical protein
MSTTYDKVFSAFSGQDNLAITDKRSEQILRAACEAMLEELGEIRPFVLGKKDFHGQPSSLQILRPFSTDEDYYIALNESGLWQVVTAGSTIYYVSMSHFEERTVARFSSISKNDMAMYACQVEIDAGARTIYWDEPFEDQETLEDHMDIHELGILLAYNKKHYKSTMGPYIVRYLQERGHTFYDFENLTEEEEKLFNKDLFSEDPTELFGRFKEFFAATLRQGPSVDLAKVIYSV